MKEVYTKELVDAVYAAIASYQFGEEARRLAKDPENLIFHDRGEAWFAERELMTKRVLNSSRKFVTEEIEAFLAKKKEKKNHD